MLCTMLPIIRLLVLSLAMGLGGLSLALDFEVLKKVVQSGNKNQQFFLGLLYADKKDYTNAILWLEKSANQGYLVAQLNLAMWYQFGYQDIPANQTKALFWYEKAAKSGNKAAQSIIAKTFLEQQNYAKSHSWYQKLTQAGDAQAAYYLAYLFARGLGVKKDLVQAYQSLKKSAKQNYAPAQYMLGLFYEQGLGVKKDEKKQLFWLEKSARNGLAKAQYKLASYYYFSDDNQQINQAIYWLKKAYLQNLPEAIIVWEALKL